MTVGGQVIAAIAGAALALGFALCVLEVALRQAAMLRRARLNPFSLADARDVLAGRHADPDRPDFFATGRGRLALALLGAGGLGLCLALFVWAASRGA